MQFNNPNILYTLFALAIPVIVHLFQLRKFQKTEFTNVKFLQNIAIKTRKSSQLKKWLLLICRISVFTCIIFAFSEPYIPQSDKTFQQPKTVFYIDNSFSNQEKGEKGELLKVAIQELIENFPNDQEINIITNSISFKNKTIDAIKNELIALEYTPNQLDYKSILLKAEQLFKSNTDKQLVCISDFQNTSAIDSTYFNSEYSTKLIQNLPASQKNISIDSAYFSTQNATTLLNVVVKNQFSDLKSVPIALYNNDSLISKTAVSLEKPLNSVAISLPNTSDLNLKIKLSDQNCVNDNTFYVSKSKPLKQHVLAIGSDDKNAFLAKIFTEDEFIFTQFNPSHINYNLLEQQHVIIINELKSISDALITTLSTFSDKGGTLIFIPSENGSINEYNKINSIFSTKKEHEVRLTTIHFSHSIYSNVFEKTISNFQFPTFKTHYQLKNYHNTLLTLENGSPLLVNNGNFYTFSAALNEKNTNFKQAPLIVPTLYNIAKNSLKAVIPYYTIGRKNNIDIPIKLKTDEVLNLQKERFNFTPLQHIQAEKVTLNIHNTPNDSGIYNVLDTENSIISKLAFNYDQSESTIDYHDIKTLESEHIQASYSVANTVSSLNSVAQVATLWKWFVIFAILFLLVELLILKYFK